MSNFPKEVQEKLQQKLNHNWFFFYFLFFLLITRIRIPYWYMRPSYLSESTRNKLSSNLPRFFAFSFLMESSSSDVIPFNSEIL